MDKELTRREIQAKLGLKDEKHFRIKYQQAAVAHKLIEMTIPDKPNSRLQKYRLTEKGRTMQEHINHEIHKITKIKKTINSSYYSRFSNINKSKRKSN